MATSYSNLHGSGDRSSCILVSTSASLFTLTASQLFRFVDGDTTTNGKQFWNGTSLSSSVWVQWDFFVPIVIDEAKYYQENTTAQGTWKWQGSNDATNWTDIGSSFTLGGSATQTITALSGNTTAYRYYRILGVSGSTSNNPWVYEVCEFKCSDTTDQRADLTAAPAGTHYCRVMVPNIGNVGHAIADAVSLLVGGAEQVTNGGVETNTTGWSSSTADAVARSLYSGISLTPPAACGVAFLDAQRGDAIQVYTYQLIDISALDLTQQIDFSAYTGGTTSTFDAASVAFCFEDASNVALSGVVMRPYLAAARSNATAVILRSLTIAAQATGYIPHGQTPILGPILAR